MPSIKALATLSALICAISTSAVAVPTAIDDSSEARQVEFDIVATGGFPGPGASGIEKRTVGGVSHFGLGVVA